MDNSFVSGRHLIINKTFNRYLEEMMMLGVQMPLDGGWGMVVVTLFVLMIQLVGVVRLIDTT